MSEQLKKIVVLLQDEKMMAKFAEAKTPEDAVAFLKANDLEITVDELHALKDELANSAKAGELSEDDLESVAGGINWGRIIKGIGEIIEGLFG